MREGNIVLRLLQEKWKYPSSIVIVLMKSESDDFYRRSSLFWWKVKVKISIVDRHCSDEKWKFLSSIVIVLMFILTGCAIPVALSAFLFTAFAWGKVIFFCFVLFSFHIELTMFTLMLSFVTSLGSEVERGTWNLTFPDWSEVTTWHLGNHVFLI